MAVRIPEKPYTSKKGKIVYVVGKPCNIYRLRGKSYDNYNYCKHLQCSVKHEILKPEKSWLTFKKNPADR